MNYGAVYGAITNPYSKKALKHAKVIYNEIRKRTTDVEKIAKYTGYSEYQIDRIKRYLFLDKHDLEGECKRFDECFEIGQSWTRLASGEFAYHDFLMLKHEIMEMELVDLGVPQNEAHKIINPYVNYAEESQKFYARLTKGEKIPEIIKEERKTHNYGRNEQYRDFRGR